MGHVLRVGEGPDAAVVHEPGNLAPARAHACSSRLGAPRARHSRRADGILRAMRETPTPRTAWMHAALLLLAVLAVYARTLAVPFYLDDFSSIRENPLVYQWQGPTALWRAYPMRVVAYLSLAANYRLGGFSPAGYHAFNILVHALASLALHALARGLLRTPRVRASLPEGAGDSLPFAAALLFAVHPLHTQAVTYVVQRLASMVALFYLAALASYVQARLATSPGARFAWGGACALAGGCAFLTKENSATLPLAALLLEAACFGPGPRRLLATAAGAAAAIAVFAALLWLGASATASPEVGSLAREAPGMSRLRYFATQLPVVAGYLRMFVWPAGLHLDHDVRLRSGLFEPDVLAALALHASLLAVAVLSWRRRPLVAFGLLFHALAHAVESSVIPIRDLAFEHRAYLPDAGLCLVAAWALAVELPRRPAAARLAMPLLAALALTLGVTAWRRNEVWRDPVRFWSANVALAPGKARPHGALGRALLEAGRPAEALPELQRAAALRGPQDLDPEGADLDALNTMWALREAGRADEARALGERWANRIVSPAVRAGFLVNQGDLEYEAGRLPQAEAAFREALTAWPAHREALANLGSVCASTGRFAEAESLFTIALSIDTGDELTRENLSKVRALRARLDSLRSAPR